MNTYQNYPAGKCNYRTSSVAEWKKIFGSDDRKETEEGKKSKDCVLIKGIDGPEQPWFCRNVKSLKKKNSRDPNGGVEEKKKRRKRDKKPLKQDSLQEKSVRKPNYLAAMESQLTKAKAGGKINSKKKPTQQCVSEVLTSNELSANKDNEKSEKRSDGRRAPLNSLFTLQKVSTDGAKKYKISETTLKASMDQPPRQKSGEKGSKPAELHGTNSDYGKRHINEILKNHAQKMHSSVKAFPVKKYSFQGVSELLKQVQSVSEAKDEKETGKGEKQVEVKGEDKGKQAETKNGETKTGEDSGEEKKKVLGPWMKVPQSNELERRLRGTWEDNRSLFPQEKDVKPEEESEEEKKTEKRTTYTDRLLLLKIIGKDLEEKRKQQEGKDTSSNLKPTSKEKEDQLLKKHELVLLNRQLDLKKSLDAIKPEVVPELSPIKEKQEVEYMFRTSQSRSAELRDLVHQAIKEHKIFCIFDNHWYIVKPVREELLSRGWLEVVPDRRLIPRRRPPPMGPTFERDKSVIERNCNTLEAILTARETFADEIQETVSKTQSFRWTIEKPKQLPAPPTVPTSASTLNPPNRKPSDDSLSETPSQFRIIPPTSDIKKNNIEIREFTAKYHAIVSKGLEREKEIKKLREKEKNAKTIKAHKTRSPVTTAEKQRSKASDKSINNEVGHSILPGSKSFQEIVETIKENKKTIVNAATEIMNLQENAGKKPELGVLFDAAQNGVKDVDEVGGVPKTHEKMVGTSAAEKPVLVQGKAVFTESEVKAMSKIIQSNNARIHFMWLSIKPAIHLKCFNYSPEIVNKFQKTTFCTKIGLWSHLNNIQWYAHEVHYPAKSPRMYNTGEADDLQAFFEDFQMTACIGLLKWLSDTFFEKGLKGVQAKKGKVPLKAFEFAIKQCEKYIRFKENEDLGLLEESKVNSDEWNTFLHWFYIITNDHGKVQESSSAQLMVVYSKAVETLKAVRRYWPEIDIDGRLNIWIMKPYCASCGRGIFMTNNVYYIGQHTKYIVQKYIEKPLLIYNTKFDIRQWFMITKLTPLEIWMYKECYLRFCTQPFALRNLHESVHLSNNSVQRKYISFRDPSLPDQNMWDSNTFQLYLKTIGQPNAWDEIIYPGMRDAIVSTMLASQDTFDGPRKSWFEVYGADFMLSANLKEGPWLIEINENPAMDPSTKVTARLCPQMLRDVIKVVVDKRANKYASTGQWELIYRQNYSPSFGTVDLDIRGKKIARVPHGKSMPNASQHPSTSPVYVKRRNSSDVESDKLYEYVKSYEKRQNNRGDATESGRARGREKKTRNSYCCRVTPKRAGLSTEATEQISTLDFPFTLKGNQNGAGGYDQSEFQAEKYKFTKFYNI